MKVYILIEQIEGKPTVRTYEREYAAVIDAIDIVNDNCTDDESLRLDFRAMVKREGIEAALSEFNANQNNIQLFYFAEDVPN